MKHTIIDIRTDGPHVVDPNATVIFEPPADLLQAAGAPEPEPLFKAGLAVGLGSFYDALRNKGYSPEVANELLWAAYENAKSRKA